LTGISFLEAVRTVIQKKFCRVTGPKTYIPAVFLRAKPLMITVPLAAEHIALWNEPHPNPVFAHAMIAKNLRFRRGSIRIFFRDTYLHMSHTIETHNTLLIEWPIFVKKMLLK
jgi:hypothetical protein